MKRDVWISSVSHLNEFIEVVSSTSKIRKIFGRFQIPQHMPFLKNQGLWKRTFPIVNFSFGEMSVDDSKISFISKQPSHPNTEYVNIDNKLNFTIFWDQIRSIDRYYHDTIYMKYYNINWIRVASVCSGVTSNFLVSISGLGPLMNKINAGNDELFRILLEHQKNI